MAVQTVFFPPPRSVDPDYWGPREPRVASEMVGARKISTREKYLLQRKREETRIEDKESIRQRIGALPEKSNEESFKQKENEKEEKNMAISFMKKSEIPSLRRVGGVTASIGDNGQIRFSTAASKAFEGCKLAGVGWLDEKKRVLAIQGFVKVPKGMDASDLFNVTVSEKAHTAFITLSGLFRQVGYDYKASGNQTFDVTVDENAHMASLVLPKGALEAKPKVARAKRAKSETPASGNGKAAAGKSESEPEQEEEEELQEEE